MTLLIKNVHILGSQKDYGERIDLFASGDKISAIGNFSDKKADQVIDGGGGYLAPGFIDVNTDSDHYLSLFDNSAQEDFLRQGVTTIIGGNCGASLAPLIYGSLEAIQKWTDVGKFNVNWHTLGELLAILDLKPLGVNFATLVGHSTIRRALIGGTLRDLTKNELTVFGETLKKALNEGAFGFSTGLGYVHSRQTPYQEIKFLVDIISSYRGVYSTHLRKTGVGVNEAVGETIKIHTETGVPALISHFLPLKGSEEEYESALEKIEDLPKEADFHFDIYPFDTTILPLYIFLPVWTQNGGREIMLSNIKDEWLKPRIINDMQNVNPYEVVVSQAQGNDSLVGRSLRDFMDMYSLVDPREALLKLMITTKLKASVFYKNINPQLIKKGLLSYRSFISSNAASLGGERKMERIERASATFTKFLGLVIKDGVMPIADAIRKITLLPARTFNIKNRGEIKEGNFADLVGFREDEIKFTVVNGAVAFKDKTFQKAFAGKPLRHVN